MKSVRVYSVCTHTGFPTFGSQFIHDKTCLLVAISIFPIVLLEKDRHWTYNWVVHSEGSRWGGNWIIQVFYDSIELSDINCFIYLSNKIHPPCTYSMSLSHLPKWWEILDTICNCIPWAISRGTKLQIVLSPC